ncbi:O-methyltransferase [Apiospora marii]|uniref:O-methyltransferase n=1 Tax=Apiospora marii TaxID=335849 RepID=UPI003130D3AB
MSPHDVHFNDHTVGYLQLRPGLDNQMSIYLVWQWLINGLDVGPGATTMRPGYSSLLVHENVNPETGADSRAADFDPTTMTYFGSKERGLWSGIC